MEFQKGMELLLQGRPFNKPIYDERLKLRKFETEKIFAHTVIIVEGHLIFTNEKLRELFDLKVFIDTDDDVRLSRRVLKHANKLEGGIHSL